MAIEIAKHERFRQVVNTATSIRGIAKALDIPYDRAYRLVSELRLGPQIEQNRISRKQDEVFCDYLAYVDRNGGIHPTSNDLYAVDQALYNRILRAYGGMRAFRLARAIPVAA